jgi:hypothetical protein
VGVDVRSESERRNFGDVKVVIAEEHRDVSLPEMRKLGNPS